MPMGGTVRGALYFPSKVQRRLQDFEGAVEPSFDPIAEERNARWEIVIPAGT